MRNYNFKYFLICISSFCIFSCIADFDSQHIVKSIKNSELRIRNTKVIRSGKTDSISLDENTFIFDTTYSINKIKYLVNFYPNGENENLFVELKNGESKFFKLKLDSKEVDSIKAFYSENQKFLELQKYIFKNYLAEEQWNIKTALRSLKSEYSEFESIDYFDYIYKASKGNNKSCNQLKLLHILMREVKLENFWLENGPRNDASSFIEKSNGVFKLLDFPEVKFDDNFDTILNKIIK